MNDNDMDTENSRVAAHLLHSERTMMPKPAEIDRNGHISLSWNDENDAWEVGNVLLTYGREHNDEGFKDDGRALMDAADEVVRRRWIKVSKDCKQ